MNPQSWLLLGVVLAAVAGALWAHHKSGKKGGCSCGCANCSGKCPKEKDSAGEM